MTIHHFESPFALEDCRSRLSSRTETSTLWAWRGQMRLQTETWKVDHDTLGFQVYRVPKSYLEFQGASFMSNRARGVAQRTPTGRVEVAVEVKMPFLGAIVYWLLMLVLWGALAYTFALPLIKRHQLTLAIAVAGGLLFLLIAGTVLSNAWEERRLLRVVKEALGGADFEAIQEV
jgi:hypothetical protein